MSHTLNFILKIQPFDQNGNKMPVVNLKAKNKLSRFDAMAGTEKYLQSKFPEIARIQVTECVSANIHAFGEEMHSP